MGVERLKLLKICGLETSLGDSREPIVLAEENSYYQVIDVVPG